MIVKINTEETLVEAMENRGTKVNLANGATWYYYPFWVIKKADGSFEEVTYKDMPAELIEKLISIRDGK